MGNWKLARWQEQKTLTPEVQREMRRGRPAGLSRRTLIRRSIAAAVGLWLLEVTGGLLGFLWPNLSRGFGGQIVLGDFATVSGNPAVQGVSLSDGAPAYYSQARTYVQLIDPARQFAEGTSTDGEGLNTNVRTLYQRCPHLGCKPNFCTTNYWFECPCHGSRYDRLGTKVKELGPAPRSLDRFAHIVEGGVLTVDTSKVTLGPLPVALGQPGLIPGPIVSGLRVSDDRTGRDLVPRPEDAGGAVTPREPALPQPAGSAEIRFAAGDQTHTVGLTEERAAQVVRQSGNARMVAFLGVLLVVLFIPIYWLYDIGLPVIGVDGRLAAEAEEQYVTDVSRGYALFLANCARCHGNNGEGGVGPVLNDQSKLYNAVTEQGLSGKGHLNLDYIRTVLEVGGRYVCGDANSAMPAWLEPKGPLNYREVEDIARFITASKDLSFTYQPAHVTPPETIPPPVTVQGWRDPAFSPAPGATPVPACWHELASTAAPATPAPVENPGTVENPRVIEIQASEQIQWVDPETGDRVTAISVVRGETIEIHVINESQTPHNLHIGSATELAAAPMENDLPGVATFTGATQSFTYTFDNPPADPQFACTVSGHYQTMHGDFLIAEPGGASGSPQPSDGASPSPSMAPM